MYRPPFKMSSLFRNLMALAGLLLPTHTWNMLVFLEFAEFLSPLPRAGTPHQPDNARKLEQQELEATYSDAWAVGGNDESDCVCRGGRCPRMWDCPFWVDRRRAEAKGSSAHVSKDARVLLRRPHTCGDESPGLQRVPDVLYLSRSIREDRNPYRHDAPHVSA